MNHWENNRPILDNLPGENGKYNNNIVANWLTTYFDEFLVNLKDSVTLIQNYLNFLDTCPDNYLDFFGNLAGFTGEYWAINYPRSLKIALIKRANWIFSNKGTSKVLSYVLTHYGIKNEIVNDGSFILGTNVLGDRLGFSAFNYAIFIDPTQENIETLRKDIPQFQKLYAPVFCRGSIIEDNARFVVYGVLGDYNNDTGVMYGFAPNNVFNALSNAQLGQANNTLLPETVDYRARIEAVGFNRSLSFWVNLDKLLRSLELESIQYLNLFIGDELSQKNIPIIQADSQNIVTSVDQTGNDSINFDNASKLTVELNSNFDYVQLSFSVTLQNNNGFIEYIDEFENPITNRLLEINNTGFNQYNLTSNLVNYSFNYLSNGVINGILTSKNEGTTDFNNSNLLDLTAQNDSKGFIIGNNSNNDGFSGTIYYVLAGTGTQPEKNDKLITNYLLSEGYTVNGASTRYHLDTFDYVQRVNNSGSTILNSSVNIVNSLIEDLINIDVYDKVQYLYLLANTDISGIGIGLDIASSFPEITVFNIGTGIIIQNNQKIESDETYTQVDFNADSFSHIFSGFKENNLGVCNLFSINIGSIRYGIVINRNNLDFYGMSNVSPDFSIPISRFSGTCGISVDLGGKFGFYNQGFKVGEVTRTIPNFSNRLRIGNNVSEILNLYTFGKFNLLSDSEILSLDSVIKNYNSSLSRIYAY